jgi:hypothetical protein
MGTAFAVKSLNDSSSPQQDEEALKQAFSEHDITKDNNKSYYHIAQNALNAQTVPEAKKYHELLIESKTTDPDLKEKVSTVLKNAKSCIKDDKGNNISHAQIQEELGTHEYIKAELLLKTVCLGSDPNKPENKKYFDEALNALTAKDKRTLIGSHFNLIYNNEVDPDLKEKVATILGNVPTHVKDDKGNSISHAQIQKEVGTQDRIQNEKLLKEACAGYDLTKPGNKKYYNDVIGILNSTNYYPIIQYDHLKGAEYHYANLMKNQEVDRGLKEGVDTVLKSIPNLSRDGKGGPVSYDQIQHKAQERIDDEKRLSEGFAGYDLTHQANKEYYHYALNAMRTNDMQSLVGSHFALISNAKVDPDLKENVANVLKNTPSQVKDEEGLPLSHRRIQKELSLNEQIQNEKQLKKALSEHEPTEENTKHYDLSRAIVCYRGEEKEDLDSAHKTLMTDNKVDPVFKVKVANILKNAPTPLKNKDDTAVLHGDIQNRVHKNLQEEALKREDSLKSE